MKPTEHGYQIDEPASSELEVRGLLRTLVLVTRPALVVETGCYLGRGTIAIADALREARRGRLVSCDTEPSYVQGVNQHLERHQLPGEVRTCRGVDLPELREADLVFLDSDYRWRRAEFDLVKPGALVLVHDTRISYDSEVPPHEGWVRDAGGILFNTHRGFGLVRKP